MTRVFCTSTRRRPTIDSRQCLDRAHGMEEVAAVSAVRVWDSMPITPSSNIRSMRRRGILA